MQMENYTVQFTQDVNSLAEYRITNETIDKYNELCNVWEPPGEQPTPWNMAKHDIPGASEMGGTSHHLWPRGPLEHFSACV